MKRKASKFLKSITAEVIFKVLKSLTIYFFEQF